MGGLEFLDDVSSEVVDVAPVALDGVSETAPAKGSLVDVILEDLISSEEGLQFMGIGVFVHTDRGGDEVLGFEGAISHHGEDINYIMGEAVGVVVAILSRVVHFELTS